MMAKRKGNREPRKPKQKKLKAAEATSVSALTGKEAVPARKK